jgi:hypothetical protein
MILARQLGLLWRSPSNLLGARAARPPDFRTRSGCAGGDAGPRPASLNASWRSWPAGISRSRFSEAERAEHRQRDRERLKQAAEQLLTSDGWQRWVRVRARAGLRRLSPSNHLLVAMACPEATFVAGFKPWLRLGYCVPKGQRAIAIIAPLPRNDRDKLTGEETGEAQLLFKTVFVFDRSQVAPLEGVEQAPLKPPSQPLTGDSHQRLTAPMVAFAESLGYFRIG